jgi:hypothetical protein
METATREQLTEKLDRYERTLVTLKGSDVKEVRLMFGSVAHMIVCDEVFPIAELKRSYMQAIKARIIELKYEIMKLSIEIRINGSDLISVIHEHNQRKQYQD